MKNVSKVILKLLKQKTNSRCQNDNKREDAEQKPLSMTPCFNKGFTLIELLVVVLIIGILSSVALPQYTKAVRKARIVEARTILSSWVKAEDLYVLENGTVSSNWNNINSNWDDLSVEIPMETKNWTFHQEECILNGCGVYASPKWESGYQIECWSSNYENGESILSGKCYCSSSTDEGDKICKSLGSLEEDRYLLN